MMHHLVQWTSLNVRTTTKARRTVATRLATWNARTGVERKIDLSILTLACINNTKPHSKQEFWKQKVPKTYTPKNWWWPIWHLFKTLDTPRFWKSTGISVLMLFGRIDCVSDASSNMLAHIASFEILVHHTIGWNTYTFIDLSILGFNTWF